MSYEEKATILSSFVSNLQSGTADTEIVEICITGIQNVINAADDFFKQGQGEIIMNEVFKCCEFEDDADVRVTAVSCIVDVVTNFYSYIEQFP